MQLGSVNISHLSVDCRLHQTSALLSHSAVTLLTRYYTAAVLTFLLCSCSGSDSESLPPEGDQVVPSHGHHLHSEVRGLADAAWDDAEPRAPSPQPPVIAETPNTHAQTSAPEPEPETRTEQGDHNNDDDDEGLM